MAAEAGRGRIFLRFCLFFSLHSPDGIENAWQAQWTAVEDCPVGLGQAAATVLATTAAAALSEIGGCAVGTAAAALSPPPSPLRSHLFPVVIPVVAAAARCTKWGSWTWSREPSRRFDSVAVHEARGGRRFRNV